MTMHRALALAGCTFLALACDSRKLTEPAADPGQATAAPTPVRTFLQPGAKAFTETAAATVSGDAPHNPRSERGSELICFSGTKDGDQGGVTYGGTCQRMVPTKDGAELRTNDGDPDGSYAGVWAVPVTIRTKLIGNIQELRYSYAGGPPSGGSPRWSVAIDEDGDGIHEAGESYAFADATACNDGDGFVGTSDAEDDATCQWFYEAESFPNWDAFAAAHPTYRIPRRTASGAQIVPAFIITDAPAHTLIWDVEVR